MTLPPSLSDLDAESELGPELNRLTLAIADLTIDIGLPANIRIADYIGAVIDIANEQIALRDPSADTELDDTHGRWTLARLGGAPIDPHHSLNEADIYDGELLMIVEVGRPVSPLLFDDVDVDPQTREKPAVLRWLAGNSAALTCFGVALAAAVTLAAVLPRWGDDPLVPALVLALGALGVTVACVMAFRPVAPPRSAWVAAVSFPLVFGGSLHMLPGASGAASLPMAFALTALGALFVLLVSGAGRALHAGVLAACTFGGISGTALLLWQPPLRSLGAILATASVIVVYLAPRVTIGLSKLPIPRVPTAGEPLDDIETQGGTAVEGVSAVGKQIVPTEEGLIRRVRRANEYLTGILVAAALAVAVGCYLAVDVRDGFYWQGTAFAVVLAVVLCLRGRRHHDLVHSATLIGTGLAITIAVIVKTAVNVDDWQIRAAVALVILMVLIVAFGLVAPRREFSPVMRRVVEIVEYLAIAMMFPLCFWIIRLYAFFRELEI